MNSAALTVPMTRRGRAFVAVSSVGVVMGPHPPPPEASTKPAIRPSGTRNRALGRPVMLGIRRTPRPKRSSRTTPSSNSRPLIQTRAPLSEILERTVAPMNAPTAPETPRRSSMRLSTLPKRQWDAPDAKVVPSSAKCTAALAATGVAPRKISSVLEVMPKAIPRVPSTSWATEPARANSRIDTSASTLSRHRCHDGCRAPKPPATGRIAG